MHGVLLPDNRAVVIRTIDPPVFRVLNMRCIGKVVIVRKRQPDVHVVVHSVAVNALLRL